MIFLKQLKFRFYHLAFHDFPIRTIAICHDLSAFMSGLAPWCRRLHILDPHDLIGDCPLWIMVQKEVKMDHDEMVSK